jgi:hypothetical protein
MPLFQSLSFVVNEQIRQNQVLLNNGISLRSVVSQQLQVVNTNKNNIINDIDVLRWGYSNWGIEKVTSEYKPQETK